MTPERFAEIDRVVGLALEREPGERASFVEQTCGADVELRHQVETLLKCHEQRGPFLADRPLDLLGQFIGQEQREEDREQQEKASLFPHQATLGRYVVTGELGSGGMGCVYAAYDPELDRKVAIKLMRPEGLRADRSSDGRARLLREAQAMARLSHPNVIAVHDVGTFGPQVFIAMEYVEGSTLAHWLTDRKRSWREVVSMFIQAGRGLAAAHAAGIVHRDFKPDNVLVDKDGRARVLDFGLARPAQLPDTESSTEATAQLSVNRKVLPSGAMLGAPVTEAGKVLGTPEYMAPEQLMGEPGDEKADQFAFCVALYQGLYGEHPFARDPLEALVEEVKQGHVRAPPDSPRVPQRLRRTLLRGLRSNPAERFSSMAELLDELQLARASPHGRWTAVGVLVCLSVIIGLIVQQWKQGAQAHQIHTLAVLPFKNLSGDPSLDPILEQLNESLVNNLGQLISRIQIISRDSTIKFRQASKPLPAIAKELDADAVIAGSVATSRPQLRLDLQLHDSSDRQLWARSYLADYNRMPALLADLATDLVLELEAKLTPTQQASLSKVRSTKSEVYEAYVKGQHFLNTHNESSIRRALKYFEEALREDSQYAPAHAGVAQAYMFLAVPSAVLSPREGSRLGSAAALKALSLDPTLAEAHAALGFIRKNLDWDWRGAEQEFKRALELNPNHAHAHHWYSSYLLSVGRADESLLEGKRAQRLNPVDPHMPGSIGEWHVAMGHYDEAIREYQKGIELDPYDSPVHAHLSGVYEAAGRHQEAFEETRKAYELSNNPWQRVGMAHQLAHLGRTAEADEILTTTGARMTQTAASFHVAATYSVLRRKEEALRWLQYAFDARANGMLTLRRNPDFEWLRSDTHFQELVSRIDWPQ